jgi:hypothetical protein
MSDDGLDCRQQVTAALVAVPYTVFTGVQMLEFRSKSLKKSAWFKDR